MVPKELSQETAGTGRPLALRGKDPDTLFGRAKAGDEAAWRELVAHCYEKVRRVVRRGLDRPMRTLYDSTDIANDVFTSLVAKSDRFEFATIEEVRAYLIHAARQKVIDEYRKQHRDRRNLKRRRLFGDLAADAETSEVFDPAGRDPSPSQQVQAVETREQILANLSGPDQEVVILKAQDFSNEETASRTGMHLRKVQRIVKKVSESWFARGSG
jgi:RNA polymerase sigma factor (sigma-70 family)